MKKTPWKMGMMILSTKMSLVLLALLLFAGLTACEQAEKAMDEVTQSAEQVVDTAKDKAVSMLEGTEEEKDEKEEEE